jgi:hypothetical protein
MTGTRPNAHSENGSFHGRRTRVNRKLAAILAADVVGYSRLMGADEATERGRLVGRKASPTPPPRREVLLKHRGDRGPPVRSEETDGAAIRRKDRRARHTTDDEPARFDPQPAAPTLQRAVEVPNWK